LVRRSYATMSWAFFREPEPPGSRARQGLAVVSADSRLLMSSAGSSRVCPVSSGGYLPFLIGRSWAGNGQDLIAGWGVRGTRTLGHWTLVDLPFATSYFRSVLERLSKSPPGQMVIPWASMGRRSVLSPTSLCSYGIGNRAQSRDGAGDHSAVFVFKPSIMGAWGSQRGASCHVRCGGWAPHRPFIKCGLHSVSSFIITPASTGQFQCLPSILAVLSMESVKHPVSDAPEERRSA
jgi:hypothetical protein